eukprot:m.90101 g.90101  ORF g.90101 m.90101 type:complete len:100 (+) comp51082_c0_seq2:77-376(+)
MQTSTALMALLACVSLAAACLCKCQSLRADLGGYCATCVDRCQSYCGALPYYGVDCGGGTCFPALATVELENGELKPMFEVRSRLLILSSAGALKQADF